MLLYEHGEPDLNHDLKRRCCKKTTKGSNDRKCPSDKWTQVTATTNIQMNVWEYIQSTQESSQAKHLDIPLQTIGMHSEIVHLLYADHAATKLSVSPQDSGGPYHLDQPR
jgi:hypothetical protein